MPKVSIVIPSLNVVDYIRQSLDSVVNQTLKDIEIICVDANSDDGTREIITEYASNDSRIIVIDSDKKSYGYQMNIGIERATGTYIGIVEPDDYIDINMYEELYKVAKSQALDYVKSDSYIFSDKYSKRRHMDNLDMYYDVVLTSDNKDVIFSFWTTNWCGIYRRDYINEYNIRHHETPGASYQDTGFLVQVMMYVRKCMYIDKAFYHYRADNPNSSVNSKGKMLAMIKEHQWIHEKVVSAKRVDVEGYINYYRIIGHWMTLYRLDVSYVEEYVRIMLEDYNAFRDKVIIPACLGNSFIDWIEGISNNPEDFIESYTEYYRQIEEFSNYSCIYIYGIGAYLRSLFSRELFCISRIYSHIQSLIVSKKDDSTPSEIEGISIQTIDEIDISDNDGVIVAVKPNSEAYNEIMSILQSKGVKNIMDMQYIVDNMVTNKF